MEFENILNDINGFGPFQLVLLALVTAPRIVLPCHFLLNNFIAAVPPHHCNIGPRAAVANLTEEQKLTVLIPIGDDGSPQSCEVYTEPQFQFLFNRSSSTVVQRVRCPNGWVYNDSIISSSLVTEFDLVCNYKHLPQTTGTIFFVGVMLGAIAFGYICDKFGRRNTLLVSYLLSIIFALASAFANSYSLFAVFRFFTGFGLSGIGVNSLILCIEWVDTKHRSFIGVIGSISWCVGNMLLAGLAYLVTDWRNLILTVTAPLGLAVLIWWWIPESARWLLANGKVEQAQTYLDRCAKFNKRPKLSSRVNLETLAPLQTLGRLNKNYSYFDLVKTPKMRLLSLLMGIVWYGVASTYYSISLNITGFGLNMYLTHFIYAAIELPAKVMVFFLVNVVGRRKCQSGTLLMTGTCIAINILIPKDLWHVRTMVAVLGKGLSEAAFTTVFLYTSELYPTVVRQNSLGYTNFVSRVGVAVAPLILLLEDIWMFFPQIIICCLAVASGLAALLLPETLNIQLPETIDDIEKPREKLVSGEILNGT